MKTNTIKWRIFKYNLLVMILLIALTTIIFNIAIRLYIEKDITKQLKTIASRAEETTLHRGPDFFRPEDRAIPQPPRVQGELQDINLFRFYFMLDRSLREPLSLLNADYILLDKNKEIIKAPDERYFIPSKDILEKITDEIGKSGGETNEVYFHFRTGGTDYITVIKPVSGKNTFGLGWIIVYSSLQKLNQLQWGINTILSLILLVSAIIIAGFSSLAAKKISAPFSSLNHHIREIAERKFGKKILLPVDDELQELVNNINTMSEKLETYDKAQKTFLQNASHEFRTPLMSIQSYAEGIKYEVMDQKAAADIILSETRRMTHLVEDLLYLSRLEAIEENDRLSSLSLNDLMNACAERMRGIASKKNVSILTGLLSEDVTIHADEEKLSRALTNIIDNCIRYAETTITIQLKKLPENRIEIKITDDGPGIDDKELQNIFERYYKGKKGNFGLGLSISKSVIEKHNGEISAGNSETGAWFKVVLPVK